MKLVLLLLLQLGSFAAVAANDNSCAENASRNSFYRQPILIEAYESFQRELNGQFTGLTAIQVRRAEQITTYFENGTVDFKYDYIENLNDGRGFTAGRVGFCSGTGDLIQVVSRFCKRVRAPADKICSYLPRLNQINAQFLKNKDPNPDVTGLDGFEEAWRASASNLVFREVQDEMVNELYLFPALDHAKKIGIRSALGKAILYDTMIMHGDELSGASAKDGTSALIKRTNALLKFNGKNEIEWLNKFLDVRRADLQNPYNHATQEEWSPNVWRVDELRKLFDYDLNLDKPATLHAPLVPGTAPPVQPHNTTD